MTERRYTKEAFDADPEWFEQVVCEDMAEEIVHRTESLVECKAEVERLREENAMLWSFVKAIDAVNEAVRMGDRASGIDAEVAAAEARGSLQQRERIAKLERENAALWAFVKATDAIGTAMTANDQEAALDAAEAATEARAALNDLRGDR